MARNIKRDEILSELRKNRLLEAGFRLCAEKGIEAVSLQEIAEEADVAISTLYSYYQNKVNLVIAISAKIWGDFWGETLKKHGLAELQGFTAYQLIAFYNEQLIWLYTERPEILRFSGNYKTYIRREGATEDELSVQLKELTPLETLFHLKYEQAKIDKSIRTDLPESKLFVISAITMLAVAERYAMGLVWADDHTNDHRQELESLNQMILAWLRETT